MSSPAEPTAAPTSTISPADPTTAPEKHAPPGDTPDTPRDAPDDPEPEVPAPTDPTVPSDQCPDPAAAGDDDCDPDELPPTDPTTAPTEPTTPRVWVSPASTPAQSFGSIQIFTLQMTDASQQPVGIDPGTLQPSYELTLAYYETVGTVGHRCRYHDQPQYVQRCHLDPNDFPPPSTLTLAADGTAQFRIVCHDPHPETAGNAHTYNWELRPDDDAPPAWPPTGQFTCTDSA